MEVHYSLSRTPPNQSSILVFVHGVFQRGSGNAYTLSGSTINFGSATPSGTDAVTVHYVATENNSVPTVADASITNAKLNLITVMQLIEFLQRLQQRQDRQLKQSNKSMPQGTMMKMTFWYY